MYVPSAFALDDRAALYDFIDANGFGVVFSRSGPAPGEASHLPFLLDRGRGCLFAHMSRANPQWRGFEGAPEVLVVFSGVHGYISPGWYETRLAVPTWNYEAVHVRGRARTLAAGAPLRHHLMDLVARHEGEGPQAWRPPDDAEYARYLARIEQGIVGFEVLIDEIEGKAKMSQDRPTEDRRRVIEHLRRRAAQGQALAERIAAAPAPDPEPPPPHPLRAAD